MFDKKLSFATERHFVRELKFVSSLKVSIPSLHIQQGDSPIPLYYPETITYRGAPVPENKHISEKETMTYWEILQPHRNRIVINDILVAGKI
jgi:hypothetical protein